MSFTKSLRYKLTMTYSLVFLGVAIVMVGALNIYLNSYLRNVPIENAPPIWEHLQRNELGRKFKFEELAREEQERVKNVRLNDLYKVQTLSLFSLIPITVLSFGLGYLMAGSFIKPLDELRLKIDKIKANRLGERLDVISDDEIGKLTESFNEMSVRLMTAFEIQKQFVEDASHELKTPLTVIQTNLDTVLDDRKASRGEYKKAIENALEGMIAVRKLTDDLLTLTRPNGHHEDFDIAETVEYQVESLSNLALDYRVKLNIDSQVSEIIFNGSEFEIQDAIRNLIENAIKYSSTEPGPVVDVAIDEGANEIEIIVHDNGPGIPKAEQKKIFERFYRVDKSRSKKSGGFGLGLAITKKIIEEHKGTISVKSKKNDTTFKVILPKS